MSTKFVVLSTQRSGSTWLIDTLDSHPRVAAYGELFLPEGKGAPPWGARGRVFFATYVAERSRVGRRPLLVFDYLQELYAPREGIDATGFKLMYAQAGREPSVLAYLAAKRVRVVHLVRRNTLDLILSKDAAAARRKYHAKSEEDVERIRLRVDPSALPSRLAREERKVRAARAFIAALMLPRFEISYEELASMPTGYERLLRFLGVEDAGRPLRSALTKLNPAGHAELIENYEDVVNALHGTRFAGLLRD